jgi:cysteine desulfurase
MNEKEIYFDCGATTKPYPEVLKTFEEVSLSDYGNTSSNHALGYESNALLGKARGQVARYLGVKSEEVIFTSGASEGNNLAIKGVAYHNQGWGKKIITTKAEHASVLAVFQELAKEGFEVIYLDYDKEGKLDLGELKNALDSHTTLVSVMSVNNEVGYIFPIPEIAALIRKNSKAVFHVDATQSICKEPLDPSSYDLLTFSGHKIGGLKGSGVLVHRKGIEFDPQILGGHQEEGLRAGTVPLGLDCSIATALRISFSTMAARKEQAKKINAILREGLASIPEAVIISPLDATPFILNFALSVHKGSVVAEALSNHHIYVSTKSACSSKEPGISYVLKNAGYDDNLAKNSIRLSFSGLESESDARTFLAVLKEILSSTKPEEK